MQHEVLLAALGIPGDVIIPVRLPGSSTSSSSCSSLTYQVAPDITFLSAGKSVKTKLLGRPDDFINWQGLCWSERAGTNLVRAERSQT